MQKFNIYSDDWYVRQHLSKIAAAVQNNKPMALRALLKQRIPQHVDSEEVTVLRDFRRACQTSINYAAKMGYTDIVYVIADSEGITWKSFENLDDAVIKAATRSVSSESRKVRKPQTSPDYASYASFFVSLISNIKPEENYFYTAVLLKMLERPYAKLEDSLMLTFDQDVRVMLVEKGWELIKDVSQLAVVVKYFDNQDVRIKLVEKGIEAGLVKTEEERDMLQKICNGDKDVGMGMGGQGKGF